MTEALLDARGVSVHYCGVVAQWSGCDAASLQPFVDALSDRGREPST